MITGMFISMMFAGHHTTSGTAAWTLIELLRHPEYLAAVVEPSSTRLFAERRRGELPGAARDAAARGGHQGGAAAAPAAHPAAARRQGATLEVGGYTIGPGKLVGASPAVSNRIPEAFADAEAFDPARYLEPREEDVDQPVELDPVRRRPPPLRGRRLRDDAAEGDLLGAAARVGLRARPAAGHLPQRPLEDGRAARSSRASRGTRGA